MIINSLSKELISQLNPLILLPKYIPLLSKYGFSFKISFSLLISESIKEIGKSDTFISSISLSNFYLFIFEINNPVCCNIGHIKFSYLNEKEYISVSILIKLVYNSFDLAFDIINDKSINNDVL